MVVYQAILARAAKRRADSPLEPPYTRGQRSASLLSPLSEVHRGPDTVNERGFASHWRGERYRSSSCPPVSTKSSAMDSLHPSMYAVVMSLRPGMVRMQGHWSVTTACVILSTPPAALCLEGFPQRALAVQFCV